VKRTVVVLIHCGYWLIYLLLLSVILAIAETQSRRTPPNVLSHAPLIILCVAPNLVSFYSAYFLLFPRFLIRKQVSALVVFGSLVCLASAFLGVVISPAFFGFEQVIFSDAREFFSLTASLFVIALIHGGIALVVRGFIAWYDELTLKEELTRKNFEMELALVKSQINPHFLFNTINNIDVLISKNAGLASEYLNKLSGILRYMVYEAKTEKISLDRELDYIKQYLELQKIRTTNPEFVNFEVTGDANHFRIAPMILFPFIENAFKHTERRKGSNSIRIKVSVEENELTFECVNSYQTEPDKTPDCGGVGDELIRRRLALTYPGRHSLEVADDGGTYKVKLTLYEN
jgi:LytS/YehU family sensor histidine kinase